MELLARIKTQADVDDLVKAREAYEETRAALVSLGEDTGEVDAKIAEIDDTLADTRVRSIQFIDTLEQQAKALRKNGQDAGAMEKRITGLRKKLGVKKASFFSRLTTEVGKFVESVPGASRVLDLFGGLSGKAAAGVGLLVVALLKLKDALLAGVQGFAETQDAVIDLDQALANNGQLTDQNREKVQALAAEFQDATGIADNEWLAALTRIAKLKIPADQFEEYLTGAKNLSAITGDAVEESVKKLGEALNGSAGELGNLGIQFDTNADRAQEMKRLFEQLADRGAGVLEAKSKGLAGQWRGLVNATGDLLKGFGNLLARTRLLHLATSVLTGTVKVLTAIFPSAIEQVEGMSNKLPNLTLNADEATAAMESLGQSGAAADFGAANAEAATTEINEQVEALRRLAAERDQLGDARLQADIAAIDLQEARAPRTAANRERFEQARRAVRNEAAERRLGNEEFVAAQEREIAEEKLAEAMAELAKVQERNTTAIRRAETRRDAARANAGGEEFFERFPTTEEAMAELDRRRETLEREALPLQLDTDDLDLDGSHERRLAEIEAELVKIAAQREGLADFVTEERTLRDARETARVEENEATTVVSQAQRAVNSQDSRDAVLAERRRAFELTNTRGNLDARHAAARASLEDMESESDAAAEALRRNVVNSRDRNIGEEARRLAETLAQQFEQHADRANAATARNGEMMVRLAAAMAARMEQLEQQLRVQEQRLRNAESRHRGVR